MTNDWMTPKESTSPTHPFPQVSCVNLWNLGSKLIFWSRGLQFFWLALEPGTRAVDEFSRRRKRMASRLVPNLMCLDRQGILKVSSNRAGLSRQSPGSLSCASKNRVPVGDPDHGWSNTYLHPPLVPNYRSILKLKKLLPFTAKNARFQNYRRFMWHRVYRVLWILYHVLKCQRCRLCTTASLQLNQLGKRNMHVPCPMCDCFIYSTFLDFVFGSYAFLSHGSIPLCFAPGAMLHKDALVESKPTGLQE